ncbi:MAG TPA: hypothetical protein VNO21_21550, partial [Polyangiaceae bacterium]|nr:hypothetical protein [Polyangiaceae bacterium]
GTFRRDLYYRLNVIPIHVPPLRERDDDVVLLTHHVLQKLARRMGRSPKRMSAEAMRALRGHSWPGNVRELEHAVEHAFVLAHGETIELSDLPPISHDGAEASRREMGEPVSVRDGGLVPSSHEPGRGRASPRVDLFALPYAEAKRRAMDAFDDGYVREVLERAAGNLSAAARHAGLDRSNFRRIVKRRKSS